MNKSNIKIRLNTKSWMWYSLREHHLKAVPMKLWNQYKSIWTDLITTHQCWFKIKWETWTRAFPIECLLQTSQSKLQMEIPTTINSTKANKSNRCKKNCNPSNKIKDLSMSQKLLSILIKSNQVFWVMIKLLTNHLMIVF